MTTRRSNFSCMAHSQTILKVLLDLLCVPKELRKGSWPNEMPYMACAKIDFCRRARIHDQAACKHNIHFQLIVSFPKMLRKGSWPNEMPYIHSWWHTFEKILITGVKRRINFLPSPHLLSPSCLHIGTGQNRTMRITFGITTSPISLACLCIN